MIGEKIQFSLYLFNILIGSTWLAGLSYLAIHSGSAGMSDFIFPGLIGVFVAYCAILAKDEFKTIRRKDIPELELRSVEDGE